MERYKVLYKFIAEEEGELTVEDNEIVENHNDSLDAADAPEGWILVKSSRNLVGFVPRSYVQLLRVNPNEEYYDSQSSSLNLNWSMTPATIANAKEDVLADAKRHQRSDHNDSDSGSQNKLSNLYGSSAKLNSLELFSEEVVANPRVAEYLAQGTQIVAPHVDDLKKKQAVAGHAIPNTVQDKKPKQSLGNQDVEESNNDFFTYPQGKHQNISRNKSGPSSVLAMPGASKHSTIPNQARYYTASMKTQTAAVPHLISYAEREDFDELCQETDHYLERQLLNQNENSLSCKKNIDDISNSIKNVLNGSETLISNLLRLNDYLEAEKKKIKQYEDIERNVDVMNRSKFNSELAEHIHT
jgi:hypothetical protein